MMKTETVVSINSPFGPPLNIIRQTFSSHSQPAEKRMSILTGLHGDEWEGLYICHKLMAYLSELQRTRPEAFTGEVHIYPAANPQALNHLTRQWPFSGVDMNRTMGNSQNRSLPDAVAQDLLEDIKTSSDIAVDIHASNLHLKELPQVRVLEDFTKKLLPLARQSNTDLVWVHPMAGLFESTLGYNLNANKIPTLVIETGICLRIHPEWGDQMVTGLINLMRHNGILVPEVSLPGHLKSPWLIGPSQVILSTATHSGLFVGNASLGSKVTKGERLGTILDPLRGETLQEVTAQADGLLFTLREVPAVYKGALLARVALEEEPEP